MDPAVAARRSRHWIEYWEPEDPDFWAASGRRVAARNLWFSIFVEHVGFSVWTMWSVFVLFLGPAYHIDAAGKFFLVSLPTLVGAVLRVPYSFAVARFGGRNWTIASALALLVPTVVAAAVLHPGTSYTTLVLVAALAGVGGGNFASSMANINTFYPEHRKGVALGLNAGGGNIGVAVIQLLGLAVIVLTGTAHPRILLAVYLPLVVVSALCASLFMDNLATVRNDVRAARGAVADAQTWIMSLLYVGTFGSFIGYSFAFGLVLQSQFGRTPLQAAAVTFVGPLLGSLARPLGGALSDRVGGARVTFWTFLAMAAATGLVVVASGARSLPLFTVGFLALFVLSGVGNGSTYTMIPGIFRAKALAAIDAGAAPVAETLRARRLSGAAIGIISAVGALGGLFINLAFRQSFAATHSGVPACYGFFAFYLVCVAVTYAGYLRRRPAAAEAPEGLPALAEV